MRAYLSRIAIVLAAMIGLVFLVHPASAHKQADLRTEMRKLWEDHVTWTRNYIVSALAGLDDARAVAQRLLKNQEDIGAAITPYHGEAAGKKLTELLRDHILIAVDVVSAAKAGNAEQLTSTQQKWQANGEEIAAFLSGANTHWAKEATGSMLRQHLTFTTNEVVAGLMRDWAADIKAYDDRHLHMLMFADVLADGTVKQFPSKFKRSGAGSLRTEYCSEQKGTSNPLRSRPRSAGGEMSISETPHARGYSRAGRDATCEHWRADLAIAKPNVLASIGSARQGLTARLGKVTHTPQSIMSTVRPQRDHMPPIDGTP